MNRLYRVDLEVNGAVIGSVEVLAASEQEAESEVRKVVKEVHTRSANLGVYLRDPDVKPKRVLEKGEGS